MKEKRSKTQASSEGSRIQELKQLLEDTVKQLETQPIFVDWLRHEARGHNLLAEYVVLYGLSMEEAWDLARKRLGNTKAEALRRRLKESMEAFGKKK